MAKSKALADLIEDLSAYPHDHKKRPRQTRKRPTRKEANTPSSPPHLHKLVKSTCNVDSDVEFDQPQSFSTATLVHAAQDSATPQFSPGPASPAHQSPQHKLPGTSTHIDPNTDQHFSQFMGWLQSQISSSVQQAATTQIQTDVKAEVRHNTTISESSDSKSDSGSDSESPDSNLSDSDNSSSDGSSNPKQPDDVKLLIK